MKNFEPVCADRRPAASIANSIAARGTDLPDGFGALAIGQSVRARYQLHFTDPSGRALRWTLRFHSVLHAGSTDVTVTRVGTSVWTIEATDADVGELLSTTTSGKTVTVSKGFYTLPFRMTVAL